MDIFITEFLNNFVRGVDPTVKVLIMVAALVLGFLSIKRLVDSSEAKKGKFSWGALVGVIFSVAVIILYTMV